MDTQLSIFISHSSRDIAFVHQLADSLRQALRDRQTIWYDVSNLRGGDTWWSEILHHLDQSNVFLVILSKDAMDSRWVRDEINIAWRRRNSSSLSIIPLCYHPCKVPLDLDTLHIIDFTAPLLYDKAFQSLLQVLERITDMGMVGEPVISKFPETTTRSNRPPQRYVSRRAFMIGFAGSVVGVGGGIYAYLRKKVAPGRSPLPQGGSPASYTYHGHTHPVVTVSWSPNGERIASGSFDHTVQVWDATTGNNALIYSEHNRDTRGVTWSPDGASITSGDVEGVVKEWNAISGLEDFR